MRRRAVQGRLSFSGGLLVPQHELPCQPRSRGFDTGPEAWRRVWDMARRFGTWLVVLALVVTTGGHWVVLQMCAWTGMLVRFSQEGSVSEAIWKTFDGKHPCRLCKLVRQGRAQERGQGTPIVVLKFDLLAPAERSSHLPDFGAGLWVSFGSVVFAPQRPYSPPVPPPRAV